MEEFSCRFQSQGKSLCGSVHKPVSGNECWVVFGHGFTGHRIGPGYLYVKISRALAAAGISSLRFDFSGSGESEGAFADMTLTTMRSDFEAALSYATNTLSARRMVLFGHSLGGTVAALCSGAPLVNGLALLAPVGDPMGLVKRREELIRRGPNERGLFENGPHEMSTAFLDALRGVDPVKSMAAQLHGRLLLIQGDADPSIAVEESARYITAAKSAGIDSRYHIVKGADHNFSSVAGHTFVITTMTEWTKECFA